MVSLKAHLLKQLKKPLPGTIAHIEAAPYRCINFKKEELAKAKKSGVLILFYKKNNEPYIVLMQRPKYKGTHSGQISFPGGKQEKTDKDITETALREANEEVGVISADVELLGQLTDVYIPVSKFNVTPVLGFVDYCPNFIIDKIEVEELIELRLVDITELRTSQIKLSNGSVLNAPCFMINGKIIWGATALMLNELRHMLKFWKIT